MANNLKFIYILSMKITYINLHGKICSRTNTNENIRLDGESNPGLVPASLVRCSYCSTTELSRPISTVHLATGARHDLFVF